MPVDSYCEACVNSLLQERGLARWDTCKDLGLKCAADRPPRRYFEAASRPECIIIPPSKGRGRGFQRDMYKRFKFQERLYEVGDDIAMQMKSGIEVAAPPLPPVFCLHCLARGRAGGTHPQRVA